MPAKKMAMDDFVKSAGYLLTDLLIIVYCELNYRKLGNLFHTAKNFNDITVFYSR
jgi:hypothetical protein